MKEKDRRRLDVVAIIEYELQHQYQYLHFDLKVDFLKQDFVQPISNDYIFINDMALTVGQETPHHPSGGVPKLVHCQKLTLDAQ